MNVLVSNIQRFSLHDGPGIRTTVFFKGCNLKCPWCANPENISFQKQEYTSPKDNHKGIYGYEISLDELEKEILKDIAYYENEGGVTFSGGEPLWQMEKIEPLLINLKEQQVNTCVETAMMVPSELVQIAIKYIDLFIIDIKILEKEKSKEVLNGDIDLYKENLNIIFKNKKRVIFRIPLIPNFTVTENNLKLIEELLKNYQPEKVEIFNIHRLAENKYKSLEKNMPYFDNLSDQDMNAIRNNIESLGINVAICKI